MTSLAYFHDCHCRYDERSIVPKKKQLNDQQICFEENVTMDQAQANGGYGVISLFDGVSSVVPTLTRKFVKFGARKLGRYCRVWYCCFGEDIA